MKNISVTTFIHLIFMLVLTILLATFYYFNVASQEKEIPKQIYRYKLISDSFLLNKEFDLDKKKLKQFYRDYSIKPVATKQVIDTITKRGKTIFDGKSIYGRVRIFETSEHHYIYVQRMGYHQMFLDNQPRDYTYQLAISIGSFLLVLFLLIYLMILGKLYPLKRLHGQIEQFADGDLEVKIDNQGGDEIGKIAQSFDKAISHIRQLISSKNLFMRNIMHELKTPITKGRIVSETIDDAMARKILIRAFDRMNELINDLADVERITMYNFEPSYDNHMMNDVIERTESVLMADVERYTIQVDDRPLHTDLKLLALSLKNLMDNGIKYGTDNHVLVRSVGNRIEVRSKGEPLKEKFAFYIEPFSQYEKRSHGFGLGLYIVNNILEKLGYDFRYRHDAEQGENVFEIVMNE